MNVPMMPRFLRVIRVEDERISSPAPRWPIEDLGRIGEWEYFVRGLAKGEIAVVNDDKEIIAVRKRPEVITVDFRFDNDSTTPSFAVDPRAACDPVFGRLAWSQQLLAKNTGVLIGATLMGFAAQNDIPTVTTLHTLVPDHTRSDISTVLLVGQILACAKDSGFEDEDKNPVVSAFNHLGNLPTDFDEALKLAAPKFRNAFLSNLGIKSGRRDQPVCLFVNPESVQHLLTQFDAATSDIDLDERLSKAGLEIWDRDGDGDCLDLRSLFMDHLTGRHPDRRWGLLPLNSVQNSDPDGERGKVLEFIEKIRLELSESYEHAARIVRANREEINCSIMDYEHPSTRLLGLLFAYVEEGIRIKSEFSGLLDQPWDPFLDEPQDDSRTAYTLRELLESLTRAISWIANNYQSVDGYWPITGQPVSIMQGIQRYLAEEGETRSAKILCEVLQYSEDETAQMLGESGLETPEDMAAESDEEPIILARSVNGYRRRINAVINLLNHLQIAGVLAIDERQTCNSKDKRKRKYFRPIQYKFSVNAQAATPLISQVRVAKLLGFRVKSGDRKSEQVTNEIKRIVQRSGYVNHQSFLTKLAIGPIPAHLARAAQWYVTTYHPELPMHNWPKQCVM